MANQYGVWVHWTAWYPVRVGKRLAWLRTIERKRVPFGWYLRELPKPVQDGTEGVKENINAAIRRLEYLGACKLRPVLLSERDIRNPS